MLRVCIKECLSLPYTGGETMTCYGYDKSKVRAVGINLLKHLGYKELSGQGMR